MHTGNGVHAAFIVGEELKNWRPIDRPAIAISAEVNGAFVTNGVGANAFDDPMNCLVWLVNSCTTGGHSISAGDLVTTGNIAKKAIPTQPGDTVVASFSGLGEVHGKFYLKARKTGLIQPSFRRSQTCRAELIGVAYWMMSILRACVQTCFGSPVDQG